VHPCKPDVDNRALVLASISLSIHRSRLVKPRRYTEAYK